MFCQILRISWQRSYCDATRALGDVTAMSRGTWRAPSDLTARLLRCYGDLFPPRPHWACFEHVENLAATSATLGTSLRSAGLPGCSVRSHNDPAAISGDLADFADRSEVVVLCDWGITSAHPIMVTLVNIMVMNGWLTPISFHVNRPSHFWDKGISDSDLETSKIKVMSEVKGQGHISYPVSNQCTPFSLHIKMMFDLEKTRFVVIGWVVLILLGRQANFC